MNGPDDVWAVAVEAEYVDVVDKTDAVPVSGALDPGAPVAVEGDWANDTD